MPYIAATTSRIAQTGVSSLVKGVLSKTGDKIAQSSVASLGRTIREAVIYKKLSTLGMNYFLKHQDKISSVLGEKAVSSLSKATTEQAFKQATNQAYSGAMNSLKTVTIKEGLAGAGKLTLSNIATGLLIKMAIEIVTGTAYNMLTSIGAFNSGKEMLESENLIRKVKKIKEDNIHYVIPTCEEIKSNSKAKSKSGFLSWILGAQSAGERIKDKVGTTGMIIRKVDDVPVAITSLCPVLGTMDANQLRGCRVLIATAFFGTGKKIKCVPVARGYLTSGSKVNASMEAVDIYWGDQGVRLIKDERTRSLESYSNKFDNVEYYL